MNKKEKKNFNSKNFEPILKIANTKGKYYSDPKRKFNFNNNNSNSIQVLDLKDKLEEINNV